MNPLLIRWDQKKHPRQDQGPGDQNPITRVIRRYLNQFGHRFAVLHFDRKLSLQRCLVEAIIGRIMDNMVPRPSIQLECPTYFNGETKHIVIFKVQKLRAGIHA
jgi:hypothetical protein